MIDSDSSDDEVVIMPHLMKSLPKSTPREHCLNNNNDVSLSMVYQQDGLCENGDLIADIKEQKNIFEDNLQDQTQMKNVEEELIFEPVQEGAKLIESCDKEREIDSNDSTDAEDTNTDENDFSSLSPKEVHNSIRQDLNTLRKNNSFPLRIKEAKFLEDLRSTFMEIVPNNSLLPGEKRLLPPINKIETKRNRRLSDTEVDTEATMMPKLPTIEGSPVKTQNFTESQVKFQVGEDDLSDQEIYDTSTSSGHDAASSSSDEKELDPEEADDALFNSTISERLQNKLLHALKLEELRYSPTASTCSAPLFPDHEHPSSSDEEDKNSVCSDSKLIRSRSGSRKKRHHSNRKHSDEDNLIVRTHVTTNGDLMADLQEDEVLKSTSPICDELDDYAEEDDVSETQSLPQGGSLLPAVPSDSVRERNFLVGSLTKHGSLLGADELHRYFPDRMLKLFVGTWNMQRKGVPRNLNDFLLPVQDEYLQDMYVIGVQESTQDQKKWEIKLQETLGPNHVMAHSVSHGVLHMAIFIRRDLIWFCSPFEEDRVTTRMVSQIKTKGAVAISFQFFGTSMIFVTSHFHSGETRVKERIEDYNRIKEKLKLPKQVPCNTYKSSQDDVTTRFDCTFWFGDLNFRVSQPHQIIHHEVTNPENYNFKEVLKGDQLTAAKRRGHIFCGFTEPKIKFLPTYKFNPGTDEYDTSTKLRVPSYTDRILYKSKDPNMVTCARYDSIKTLKKSDHRPVYGLYEVCLKPGRDSIPLGGGRFRRDVYEKAARLRAHGTYQSQNSAVCTIL